MEDLKNLSIEEGTITFWIKENSIIFNDKKITQLFNVNPAGGSIFMLKDNDNKLKVMFVVLGKGRVDIEHDVSELNPSDRHMIAFTWSLRDNRMNLYLDGVLEKTKQINL